MKKQVVIFMVMLLATTTMVFAGTQGTNTNTVSPTLQISANVQKAIRLTLSTGTAAVTHCAVVAGGGSPDYTMDFGAVDALGINAGNCNLFAPATPGVSNAVYWSDYNLTPVFTGQSSTTSTRTAQVTTDFAAPHNVFVVRDAANSNAVPAAAAAFTAMGKGSAETLATHPTTRRAVTRYIGVAVNPAHPSTTSARLHDATINTTTTSTDIIVF